MPYKVFLVEDEIVTREGIRDNVDWKALGFEFCGDAPDGEMALPHLQLFKPHVLITDVRMPFMDGLELSQIVRDRMPGTKIIILSGHDEFEYAQRAIKLGVSEYLLKPVSVQDIHQVLRKVAGELNAEQAEQEALQKLRDEVEANRATLRERDKAHVVTMGNSAIADYLKAGVIEGFEVLFDSIVTPLGERALRSPGVRASLFTDVVLAVSRFVDELGGDAGQVIPELELLDSVIAGIENTEQLRQETRGVLTRGLAFRDSQVQRRYAGIVRQAQEYMLGHYMDPEISLNSVAAQVNLSPSHFSAVFSQEIGQTFKEYLTEIRLKRAKELLRTTTLKAFEIADQTGYSDPHYFSQVFRKHTGVTPLEFRSQAGVEGAA